MKKVLLIAPPYERFMGYSRFYYHIGLASLGAILEKAGIDCLIYDADYNFDNDGKTSTDDERIKKQHNYADALSNRNHYIWKEMADIIDKYNPDVVGISVLSATLPAVKCIIEIISQKKPEIPIITGGPHATLRPKELLDISDYVITNEGESVIVDVVNGEYKKKSIIKGERIYDLDKLPFPAIDKLYNLDKYQKRDLSIVISGRGCPNSCKFCNSSNLWNCRVTRKSVKYFISEIKHLIRDYGIRDFFIADDSFTYDQKWLDDFLMEIEPLNVSWRCFSRIDAINKTTINKMKKAGCRHIKVGIESGSERILKMINKKITIEQVQKASRILKKCNMKWSAYFIVGFPTETEDEIRETQKLIKQISADSITVSTYVPLPETSLGDFDVDYTKHSFHSQENNFTETMDNETFKSLLNSTLEINSGTYNEHLQGECIKMTTKQKIFILGNKIEDHIFISDDNKRYNTSLSYDLFTRNIVNSYLSYSGVDLLHNLLLRFFDKKTIVKLNNEVNSQTISEWNKKKDGETERLYLKNHIGLNLKTDPNIYIDKKLWEELANEQKSYSFVIYDMGEDNNYKKYNVDSGEERKREATDIKDSLIERIKNAENIIVRTMFTNEDIPYTNLVKELSEAECSVTEKTILLCNVNEMRRVGFTIHKGISWEQLTIETHKALKSISNIDKFKAVIVFFNHEGCLIYKNGDAELLYFRDEIEGDFVLKNDKRAFGPIITVQTILTVELLAENKEGKISAALKKGLTLMRELIMHGYEMKGNDIKYPYEHIYYSATTLNSNQSNLRSIELKESEINDSLKIIMKNKNKEETVMNEISQKIITNGASNVDGPYLRLGNLISFDRREIEQLRSVYHMFKQYVEDKSIAKPLSICVFGQPGSGKSFAVKQIAKSLNIKRKTILEFNLSQMTSPQELFAAFHQIRDSGLMGNLPVVFFDEFDSKFESKLGWLKYFLAPMQDGEFRENAIPHFLGKAIFVFAGGTCNNTQQFIDLQNDQDSKENKLPDFLSRIKGYLDISGPNPLPCTKIAKEKPDNCWQKSRQFIKLTDKKEKKYIADCSDKCNCCLDYSYYMRRATLLRSMLEKKLNVKENDKIEISKNVTNAFLKVDSYLHGARSMEALIQTSDITDSQCFTASCICKDFCDLYVTADFEEYLLENNKDEATHK